MQVLDVVSSPAVVLGTLALTLAFEALLINKVPDRVAARFGYRGGPSVFALDINVRPSRVRGLLDEYGPDGRRQMMLAHLAFDVLFPISYSLFLIGMIGLIRDHLHGSFDMMNWGRAAPIAAGVSDWLENVGFVVLAKVHPRPLTVVTFATVALTALKFALLGLSLLLVVFGLAIWL
jgi:hypothetical protein